MNRLTGFIVSIAAFLAVAAFVPMHATDDDTDAAIKLPRNQIKNQREALVEANQTLAITVLALRLKT